MKVYIENINKIHCLEFGIIRMCVQHHTASSGGTWKIGEGILTG